MWTCIVIELAILVCLARMGCCAHYVAVLVAAFMAITVFGVIVVGHDLLSADLFVYALLAVFTFLGGRVLWLVVRHPFQASVAIDTVAMEQAVAKQLARNPEDRYSYGNWRVAQEIVRKLKGQNDDK